KIKFCQGKISLFQNKLPSPLFSVRSGRQKSLLHWPAEGPKIQEKRLKHLFCIVSSKNSTRYARKRRLTAEVPLVLLRGGERREKNERRIKCPVFLEVRRSPTACSSFPTTGTTRSGTLPGSLLASLR